MLKIKKYAGGNTITSLLPNFTSTTPWTLKNFNGLMIGANVANAMLGTPKDYEGAAGSTAMGIDGFTDAASQIASQFGPTGQYIASGLQANKLLSNLTSKLTGLSGMTNTDVIMNRIPVLGLINGLGGKRADSMQQDIYTQSQSQFGYNGTNSDINNAAMKSGKKYGMFSSGARKLANWEIASAGRKQNNLKYLIKDRDTAMDYMAGSTDLYNIGYANELMGGPQTIVEAKKGTKLPSNKEIQRAKRNASKHKFTKTQLKKAADLQDDLDAYKNGGTFEFDISMFQKGGKSRKYTFEQYMSILNPPDEQKEWYDYQGHYNDDEFYPEWESKYEEWRKLPEGEEKEKSFPHSTDKYKTDKHPTYSYEGYGWKQDDKGGWTFTVSPEQRRNWTFNQYIDYWNKYEPKDLLIYSPTQTYKVGDNFTENQSKSFKEGGSIIPEGALHKNLNHLGEINPDLKGEVTTKGIPIISNEEGGEIVQHAEIEEGEIIFQKSITEKIEELYKEYNKEDISQSEKDELAIKVGKIIAKEIMEKTDDKVGLIKKTE